MYTWAKYNTHTYITLYECVFDIPKLWTTNSTPKNLPMHKHTWLLYRHTLWLWLGLTSLYAFICTREARCESFIWEMYRCACWECTSIDYTLKIWLCFHDVCLLHVQDTFLMNSSKGQCMGVNYCFNHVDLACKCMTWRYGKRMFLT